MKICSKCGRELELSCFMKAAKNKDGLRYVCKECENTKSRKRWAEAHPDIKRWKGFRTCKKCNKVKPKSEFAKYGDVCSLCKTRIKVNGFRTCKRCGELKLKSEFVGIRTVCNSCKKPMPSKIYDSEKDRRRAEKHRRKARERNLAATLTCAEWKEVNLYFGNKCAYCGANECLTQDHFVPVSKGGEYSKNNIIPACHMCNSMKRDIDFFEWYTQQGFYDKKKEEKILKYLNYRNEYQQIAL